MTTGSILFICLALGAAAAFAAALCYGSIVTRDSHKDA